MKLFSFSSGNKGIKHSANISINFEKIFFYISIILILGLIASQLANPFLEKFIYKESSIPGKPLGKEESLYQTDAISLNFSGKAENENIKILVGGEETEEVKDNNAIVYVKDGDILEIYSNRDNSEAFVTVTCKNSQINKSKILNNIKVTSNLQILGRVKIPSSLSKT